MRRFLAWTRFRRSATLAVVATLPGLLPLTGSPASAAVAAASPVTAEAATAVPVQQSSSPLLPSLVVKQQDTSTTPDENVRVKGALPLDNRARIEQKAPETELPMGVRRAEQRDLQTASSTYPMISDVYPETGTLVSVTPLLTVRADRIGGGSDADLNFRFNICEKPEQDAESPTPAPTPQCWQSAAQRGGSTWRVPASTLAWGQQYEWWVRVTDPSSGEYDQSDRQLIVTGARQPLTSAHLGERTGEGQEFSPVAGNYTTSVVDAEVAVAGPPLAVARTYNSLDARTDGIFGAGWSTAWDMKIIPERAGTVTTSLLVGYPHGGRVRFAAKGDGGYQPPPGMKDALADVSGGGWRLKLTSGMTYIFDAAGRLTKISDSRGREQTLAYGSNGTFTTVTGTGGRALHFTWNGPRVATVSTNAVDGKALTWTYGYTGDNLTSVCSPAAQQSCITYTYADGSRYKNLVLDAEPVGYFRLGDGPNVYASNLGSDGREGYYSNVTLGQPGALQGSTDAAAAFTKSRVMLPLNMLDHARDQVSVEGWFKTSQNGIIMSAGRYGYEYGASEPVLYVGTDGKLRGQLGELTGVSNRYTPISSASAVNDGQWHHVALTVAGSQQKLYLDGQPLGVLNGQIDDEYREFAFIGSGDRANNWTEYPGGQTSNGAFAFKGSIDEFAVYDRPLSEAEVQAHWAARVKAANKLAQITLPSQRIWAKNTYDQASDRLLTHTDRHGGTWQLGKPDVDWYERVSTVVVTDPAGKKLTYGYDPGRGDRLTYEIDQLSFKTSYDYDTGGFLAKKTDRNNHVFRQWNDKRGNVIQTKTCRTSSSCQMAYAGYHVNNDDAFDPRNDRMLVYRDARSATSDSNTYATKWEYNAYGEAVKETTPATPDFPNGRSITVTYTDGSETAVGGGTTPAGLIASQTDPRGNTWTYRYTSAGDLAEQSNPDGLLIRLGSDALGRLRDKTQVSQAHPGGVKTVYTYDEAGRPATQTEPGVKNEVSGVTHTKRTTYAYDADGNILSQTVSDLTGGDAERVTVTTYDSQGRVETSTDPEGGVTRQSWNTLGQLATTTDARGAVVAHGYTERGQLATQTLKGWTGSPVSPQPATDVVLASFGYDAEGLLVLQSDAMGRKTSFTYFNDNLPAKTTAESVKLNGSATARNVVLKDNTYDAAGNRTKLVAGGGKVTTEYVYDAAARLTSQTLDPATLARKSVYSYDAGGNVIKEVRTGAGSNRAETIEYAYSKTGQVTRTTVDNGTTDLMSSVDYDDRGLPVASTDPRGNADGADKADFTTTTRYDQLGRPVEVTQPKVGIDKAGVTSEGRPTTKVGYDTVGNPTHQTDAEGRTAISAFDKAGRLTSATTPQYTPPGGTAITPTVVNTYDKAGQLTSAKDPRGYVTAYDYDKLGRQVRITDPAPDGQSSGVWVSEYNLAGEKLAEVDPTGARVQATYDDLGRQITATQIERKPASATYTSKMEYDDAGRLTKQTPPNDKATSFAVNAAGEVETVTQPAPISSVTKMGYDLAGRLVKTTDPNTNATVAEYDLAGRKTAVKDLNSSGTVLRTFAFGYDPAGNPISATSPEGHVTQQTFDALNRPTSLIEPVSATESIITRFGYDATGARTRLTDGRGNTTWTGYNSLGLPETVTEPATTVHPNAADRTWTHIYDAAGNETATLQPGGVRIDRTFDHLDRLTHETGAGGDAASAERTFGYDLAGRATTAGDLTIDYNDRGLPLKISRNGVQESAYAYDALGNPSQRIDAAGTATFTYDNANRLATATDPVTSRTLTYGYDPASRLKTITATSGQAGTQSFDYDDLDRPTGHTLKSGSGTQLAKITYGWDKDDNLTTKTTAGTAGAGTNTYTYDHVGRLTSWTAPGGAVTAYEWDAAGNRTKAGDKTFTYDERNRLTSGDGTDYTYTSRGTVATSTKNSSTTNYTFDAFDRMIADGDSLYAYDALDRLVSRITGLTKQTHQYAGLGNDLAGISVSGSVQARYARDPGGGLLGLKEGTAAAAATFSDLHGDLVATYTTALQTSTGYDPFGTVTAQTGTKANLGYQGEYTDPDTGKVNMHARWYQPGTGTFTSRDTATLDPSPSVQANRYTYASASPLTGIDPTGHATYYLPDSTGSYSPGGTSGGGFGPAPGQLVIGTPEYNDTITAQGDLAVITPDTVLVMTVEQMKLMGHLPNGTQITADFWGLLKEDISEIIEMAYLDATDDEIAILIRYAKQRWKEEWEKYGRPTPAGGAAAAPDHGESQSSGCQKVMTVKQCASMLEAAALLIKAQKYYDQCAGPSPGDPLGWAKGKCQKLVKELGLGVEQTAQLAAEKTWEELKAFWTGVYDFLVEDFKACLNGSAAGCALAAINFVPGGTLVRAGKLLAKFPKVQKAVAATAAVCKTSSFAPGTLVLMADGSRKPIEGVRVGEEVLATDPATGETAAKEVTALINSSGTKNLIEINIKKEHEGGPASQSVIATAQHPFWVPSLRKWIDATYLQSGSWLRTSAGTWIQVADVKRWTAVQQVYNLSIADFHTYYVEVADLDVLVHNAGPSFCTPEDAAQALHKIWGKNRVEITMGDRRYAIDLVGQPGRKGHYEKEIKAQIGFPHVKVFTRHVGPGGESWRGGATRPGTWGDIRIVINYFKKIGMM